MLVLRVTALNPFTPSSTTPQLSPISSIQNWVTLIWEEVQKVAMLPVKCMEIAGRRGLQKASVLLSGSKTTKIFF